jgi:hypothetical protein
MREGDHIITEDGVTWRQVVRETYHCETEAETEFFLRRMIAS